MFTAPFEIYILKLLLLNFRLYGVNAFSNICKIIGMSHR
jgi:hypothetical protein